MSTEIAEYSVIQAKLAELDQLYAGQIYEVATVAGMVKARAARAELRGWRVGLESDRKMLKAPPLDMCRRIDSEAKRITAILVALEDPIDAQIKVEQRIREEAKAAKEAARLEALQAEAAAELDRQRVAQEEEIRLAREEIERERAKAAAERAEQEAAAKAEREAIAKERAVADAQRAQADRVAAEAREKTEKAADEAHRIETARIAREAEAAAEEVRIKRDAEAKRQAEERAELERQQAELNARLAEEVAEKTQRDKAARAKADAYVIETATLVDAAKGAVLLLTEEGYGGHLVTRALQAALLRHEAKP